MNQTKRIAKIGLTGSIGAGKSTVSDRFRSLGALVLDADAISRALLEPGGECFRAVAERFPESVKTDGTLDRKVIAWIVFSDDEKRAALNAIVHPAVIGKMHLSADEYLAANPDGIVIFDVPLLIECGMYRDMDRVIVIIADDAVRIERIMRRDGFTRVEAEARCSAQMPQQDKLRFADDVIDNSFSRDALFQKIDRLYARLVDGGTA